MEIWEAVVAEKPGEGLERFSNWKQHTAWMVDQAGITEMAAGKPKNQIRFEEIVQVRLTGVFSTRLEITSQSGKQLSCRFVNPSHQMKAVLDVIASRIPHRAALEASPQARNAGRNRTILVLAILQIVGIAGILLLNNGRPSDWLPPAVILFVLVVGMIMRSLTPIWKQGASRVDPVPLTRSGWLALHRGRLPGPNWKTEVELKYIPDAPQERFQAIIGQSVFVLSLGWLIYHFAFGKSMDSSVVIIGSVIATSALGQLVHRSTWERTRQNDRFLVKGEFIYMTRRGRTIQARLDTMKVQSRNGFIRPYDSSFFSTYAEFTGPQGKIECDYRYLWPVDRPLYEPESPWEELWRTE